MKLRMAKARYVALTAFGMKVTEISLMPWKWDGAVCIGGSSADFAAYAKKYANVDVERNSGALGQSWVQEGRPWLIWLSTIKDLPALAHEALHVTSRVLAARGLTHTDASEEAYTYTMEDLMRQVLDPKHQWSLAR